jgi:hypothetical protein
MRLRLLALAFAAALALTLASTAVTGTVIIDCERDDPAPCVQQAAGFPLLYIVDHHALSPTGSLDLIGALVGTDIFIARHFWADVLIWWIAALSLFAVLRTPGQRSAAKTA